MYCILCILSSVDDIECAKLLMKWTGPTRGGYSITTPGTIQNTCLYYLPVYIIYPSLLFTCVYYCCQSTFLSFRFPPDFHIQWCTFNLPPVLSPPVPPDFQPVFFSSPLMSPTSPVTHLPMRLWKEGTATPMERPEMCISLRCDTLATQRIWYIARWIEKF